MHCFQFMVVPVWTELMHKKYDLIGSLKVSDMYVKKCVHSVLKFV